MDDIMTGTSGMAVQTTAWTLNGLEEGTCCSGGQMGGTVLKWVPRWAEEGVGWDIWRVVEAAI
jgi:hypothetical protein